MNPRESSLPSLSLIESWMDENKVPGLSLAVIDKGDIVFQTELGVKNSTNKEQVSEETLFEAASLSKPVFAYAVMKWAEKGFIDLDTPLSSYLSYEQVCQDPRVNTITARMVLSHTTGFPNWRPDKQTLQIHFQPGERFSYSGEGYLYLQRVIEFMTGLSLEEFVKKTVFAPLGMNHSTFLWRIDEIKATGHHSDGTPVEVRLAKPNSAFTLHTTAIDYAKFVIAHMKEEGLKPKTLSEMLTPIIFVQESGTDATLIQKEKLSKSIAWGLGWGLQKSDDDTLFWHWGDNNGFHSFVIGSKAKKNGLVLFSNSSLGLLTLTKIVNHYYNSPQPALDWIYR